MKFKKYSMVFFSFVFILMSAVMLSEGITAQAAIDRDIKNKTFVICNLGPNTDIKIRAISDAADPNTGYPIQEPGWNKGGTITIQNSAPDSKGFHSATVIMTNVDVTKWTPYLLITTSHSGYHPTGWATGEWGGTGITGGGTEIHNLTDKWENGSCLFYIGMGFGYNSVTCVWEQAAYSQYFNHYLLNPNTDQYELYKQTSEKIAVGTVVNPASKYEKLEGYTSVKYTVSPWNGSGWGQNTLNLPYVVDWTYAVNLYYNPIQYMVRYDGNGATDGQMTRDFRSFNRGGFLQENAYKKQYTVNYDVNGGKCPVTKDVANATFNGWYDGNTIDSNGNSFAWMVFNAPYYVNKYPDIKNAFGYNKSAVLNHWINTTLKGNESRQSSPIFNAAQYLSLNPDVNSAFNGSKYNGWFHWTMYGYNEGRKGTSSVDNVTSQLYPDKAWVANLSTTDLQNLTLVADWTNGSVILPNPSRDGYQFAGWYSKPAGGNFIGNAGEVYTPESNGGTLYAHWTANDYQIAFDGNGATSGSMANQKAKYDVTVTLNPNEFDRNGYTFTGWNTIPDGGGTAFTDRQKVKNLTAEKDGIVTLYAQWKANSYTIRFDGNGATEGTMEDIEAVYDQNIQLPENLFIRKTDQGDSVFKGWNRDNTSRDLEFANQEIVRNLTAEDGAVVILYAVWDDCPEIEAVDRYFTLDFAQAGKITEEELLSTASAVDLEDGELERRTSVQITESAINGSLSLEGYIATDFTGMTDSGSVGMTYKAVDSVGNTVYETVTVYITNTEPLAQTDFQYTRFINEKYFRADYENGGLHPDSVWRNNPEYRSTLEHAISNLKNGTPEVTYTFTPEEIHREKRLAF